MRKKLLLIILAVLSIGVILAVTFVAAPAISQLNASEYKNTGSGSLVYLNLPPAPNSTIPSVPPGTPTRPSNLQLRAYDLSVSTFAGKHDALLVYLWLPARNNYQVVALITDANDTSVYQQIWNGTFAWITQSTPNASAHNIIKVADQDLEIWTQNSHASGPDNNIRSHDMLIVNLTKAININLALNLWSYPQSLLGNLSFKLPPLTLTFREITKNSYYDSALGSLPSGWKYQPTAIMRTPAWVEERIPAWLGESSPLEVVGHIDWGYSQTFIPP